MAIEIVSFPIKNGDFPVRYVNVYQRVTTAQKPFPGAAQSINNGRPMETKPQPKNTLWLCQNSYWKWPFVVDFPIKNGDFP